MCTRQNTLLYFGVSLLAACGIAACDSVTAPSKTWSCDVVVRGDDRTKTGSGTGSAQGEALSTARAQASVRAECQPAESL